MNNCERMMKVDFEPLALKKTIDSWIQQVERDVNEDKWTLRKEEPEIRIWSCEDGLPFNPDLPLLQVEMYFPDVDDPAIILEALFERRKYDVEMNQVIKDLPRHSSKQVRAYYNLSKRTIVAPREFCTKKIYFELSQAVRHLDDETRDRIVGDGDEDDIYAWITSLPDSAVGRVADGAERCESHYCFERYGYMKNLPAGRRKEKGCYMRAMAYVDFKVGWLLMKLGRPFVFSNLHAFAEML